MPRSFCRYLGQVSWRHGVRSCHCTGTAMCISVHSPLHHFWHLQSNNSEHDATASGSNVHSGSHLCVELCRRPQVSGEGRSEVHTYFLHRIQSISFAAIVHSCMCRRGSRQIPWTVFSNHKVYMFIITGFSP